MPRPDTGHLPETAVSFAGEAGDAPTSDNALVAATLGNADNVHVFVLSKDRIDGHFLFEQVLGEIDLGGDVPAVNLDFHNVGLLQAQVVELLHLSMGQDADDGAVFLDPFQLLLDVLTAILLVLESVFGKRLLLAAIPILVAATPELFTQMLGEHGRQGPKPVGGFDVPDDADDDHGRGFDDGNGVDDFALVHEGAGAVDAADDVRHAGLVPAESGQVGLIGGIVLREGTDATGVVLGALLGQEAQATLSRCFELAVRPV